jgi:hypothetical protein
MHLTGTPNWALTVKDYRAEFVHALLTFRKFSAVGCARVEARAATQALNQGAIMTAAFNKTPVLFAAMLTVATPAVAGGWRTIPEGVGTDGVCTLYNQNMECVDAARTFLAWSTHGGSMRVVNALA